MDRVRTAPRRRSVRAMAMAMAVAIVGCGGSTGSPGTPRESVGVSAGAPTSTSEAPATSGAVASGSPFGSPSGSGSATPPAILVGAGDIASCGSSGDEATAALLAGIDGTVFTAGDNVYDNGTASEFRDCYAPTWGRELSRTLPAAGNHDYNTAHAAAYYTYFGAAAGDPAEGWYARDVGSWRTYVLNSNCWAVGGCGAGSPQERWLRSDLAANPRACVLAIWHHPRFSSGEHGSSTATQALWQTLQDAGAEIVVTGHDHDYERFAPQSATGAADPAGLVEFVVGTGGRSHYPFGPVVANSVVRNDDTYGVLELRLYAGAWSFEFVPVAGKSFSDSGSGTCH